VEINECEPNPCHNGGTCADFPAAYNCTCPLGFAGTNCEINIDNCEENPCRNGGRCVDGVNKYVDEGNVLFRINLRNFLKKNKEINSSRKGKTC
jgi:hypothetical protein